MYVVQLFFFGLWMRSILDNKEGRSYLDIDHIFILFNQPYKLIQKKINNHLYQSKK